MSDTPSPMSDEEIARRLAELEASIDAESPRAAEAASATPTTAPAAPRRALLGDDDDDDGSLDYLTGAPSPAPVAAAPRPRPTPDPVVVVPTEEASSGGGKRAAGASLQPMTNPILDRAIGVARFAPRYYDAIAADPKATAEAALVVAIVAVAGGIGGLRHGVDGFLVGIVMAVVKWGLLAAAAYAILPRIAPGVRREGGIAPLARTLGYAQGPRVLAIAGLIPLIGWSLSVVGTIWVVLTSIVAIRQTAKIGFGEAAIVTVVGWVIATVVAVILAVLFGLGVGAAL
ncbi:MAG: hypothetical protein ACTHMX_16230 [Thermomicrobiales bacterium]